MERWIKKHKTGTMILATMVAYIGGEMNADILQALPNLGIIQSTLVSISIVLIFVIPSFYLLNKCCKVN